MGVPKAEAALATSCRQKQSRLNAAATKCTHPGLLEGGSAQQGNADPKPAFWNCLLLSSPSPAPCACGEAPDKGSLHRLPRTAPRPHTAAVQLEAAHGFSGAPSRTRASTRTWHWFLTHRFLFLTGIGWLTFPLLRDSTRKCVGTFFFPWEPCPLWGVSLSLVFSTFL